jgi:alpha-glucosidase
MKIIKKIIAVTVLCVSVFAQAAQLYMAGDSIMTDYKSSEWPQYGWGQTLKLFMNDPSALHNYARSGWSARRFRESGRWEKYIASKLRPGDWVIVSFGHNDMNKKRNKLPKNDYSTIDEYKAFLRGFAADAKAKGANIAFATSIAHSSGFSEKDGVLTVDGGAKGLRLYVAAMREVAAELKVPILDLNRYAEKNLPKLGLKKAKALYMFIKAGEYANYPKGKNDAAHIRDRGAFFYATAAVEMAKDQGLSLAELFKSPEKVAFVPVVQPLGDSVFLSVSPNGLNELRLKVNNDGMVYSVLRRGKVVVEPTDISLKIDGHGWLNGKSSTPSKITRKIEGALATPIYKKSSIDLSANETRVDFGDWAVLLHARNDGVAWRFETEIEGEITVGGESTTVRFPKGTELCYTQEKGFMSGWEKPAMIGPVSSVSAGHPQIVMTPFTATVPGAGVVTVTESNLLDYPGLNFYRRENENDMLRSWQAGFPDELDRTRRKIKVKSRKPYLAKTKGQRAFPWRVFALADTPSGLVESDIVYALAEPSRVADTSWIKPGLVQWDWWHGFKITDVPGLKTGCNFETYKAYVDFAATNGIEYIIMDEGWAEKLNPENPRADVNVPGVVAYAKEKGVDVILWAAWAPLTDRALRLRVFDWCVAIGAKGFKIDFMERDDQECERFLEETAADAAARKLVVMYHGIHKPTGLQRTYPNILNYEGVYGLEQGHSIGGRKVVISNDVNLVYTRMVAGFMDYTPGAMRNRAFDAPPFAKGKDPSACYGTRAHQLALFPLFEAPVQMLCDSPTQYRTAPECVKFMVDIPTVWDDTVGVAGEIGKFAVVARKKGAGKAQWWLGAITNWEAREIEIPTAFLGSGEWNVESFEDAPDADINAENYVSRKFTIKAGEKIKVRLASGGGFAAKFTHQ